MGTVVVTSVMPLKRDPSKWRVTLSFFNVSKKPQCVKEIYAFGLEKSLFRSATVNLCHGLKCIPPKIGV